MKELFSVTSAFGEAVSHTFLQSPGRNLTSVVTVADRDYNIFSRLEFGGWTIMASNVNTLFLSTLEGAARAHHPLL